METYFLRNEDIFRFYDRIARDFELYIPVKAKSISKVKCDYGFILPADDYLLKKYSEVDKKEIVFNDYRCLEPSARAPFTYFKEKVCSYSGGQEGRKEPEKPIALAGVKNCDIFSFRIQDFVFLQGDQEDPIYKKRRQNALIISGDCPNFKESCFCRAFDIGPHSSAGFDFNLSVLNNGYLLDVGSEKARVIASSLKDILAPANFGQLSGRTAKRDVVIKRMEEHLRHHKIPGKETLQEIVLAGFNSEIWREESLTCVECGGCIFICDTCHCFLLSDEKIEGRDLRLRVWDGCLLKNFMRVAGGANPLKLRYMRLRNRYMKKFDFFPDNLNIQACCGCGRCIEVCPGKIDIRKILRKLYEAKYLPAV